MTLESPTLVKLVKLLNKRDLIVDLSYKRKQFKVYYTYSEKCLLLGRMYS